MLFLALLSVLSLPLARSTASDPPDKRFAPLRPVATEIESALRSYQDSAVDSKDQVLPPLKSVELDFKTTRETVSGVSLNLWVITLGSTKTVTNVNSVSFTYELPEKGFTALGLTKDTIPFRQNLLDAIKSAALAVDSVRVVAGKPLHEVTIDLQYVVKVEKNGEAKPTYFFTFDLKGEKHREEVQELKLTFSVPDNKESSGIKVP
jgi:hypothetical protein